MAGTEGSLFGGGSGGWLHLDAQSTALSGSTANTEFTGGSPTVNFKSPGASGGAGTSSILQMGLAALLIIFIIKELK